jgi:hypothetical protein
MCHFSFCKGMHDFSTRFHKLWDDCFLDAPICNMKPIVGFKRLGHLQDHLVKKKPDVTISYRTSPARVLFFLFAYFDMLILIVLIYLYDLCVLISLVPFSPLYLYNPCALIIHLRFSLLYKRMFCMEAARFLI